MPSKQVKPEQLVSLLGSVWLKAYPDKDGILQVADACLTVLRQHCINLEKALACNAGDVPEYHTELWTPVVLQRDAEGQVEFDLPGYMVSAPYLCNRLTDISLTLAEGADYTCEDGVITFAKDPFTHWRTRVPVAGNEARLWARNAQIDLGWGYAFRSNLDARLDTPLAAVRAAYAAIVRGPTLADLTKVVAAMSPKYQIHERDNAVEILVPDDVILDRGLLRNLVPPHVRLKFCVLS